MADLTIPGRFTTEETQSGGSLGSAGLVDGQLGLAVRGKSRRGSSPRLLPFTPSAAHASWSRWAEVGATRRSEPPTRAGATRVGALDPALRAGPSVGGH